MSSKNCAALLIDGPLQSWGYTSRFDRRTTALHPTRSGIFGLIAAALGIDKHSGDEGAKLARFSSLSATVVSIPRLDRRGRERLIHRLEDYHTVTDIRRASGKRDRDATVQTYRHYLLDARFGVLLEGSALLLEEIANALRNPRWGLWLGRKCCIPASPILAALSPDRTTAWSELLRRAGYSGGESEEQFDRVVEAAPSDSAMEKIEDMPVGFGKPIGERHASRWIRRIPKSPIANPNP